MSARRKWGWSGLTFLTVPNRVAIVKQLLLAGFKLEIICWALIETRTNNLADPWHCLQRLILGP